MVVVYIEFFIDTGLSEGVHGAQGSGSEVSRRGSCGSSGRISRLLLQDPERKEV